MSRLMDDFFYLFQKGGRNQRLFQVGGASAGDVIQFIVKWSIILLKLFIIMVILYLIYLAVFRGYPRIVVNLPTLSFYHKTDLDGLIRDGDLMIKHIQFLATGKWLPLYSVIYPDNTTAFQAATNVEKLKEQYYGDLKLNEKYYKLFKDFYLYFNRVDEPYYKPLGKEREKSGHLIKYFCPTGMQCPGRHLKDNYYESKVLYFRFYRLLMMHKVRSGELSAVNISNGWKKGDEELIAEVYEKDINNKSFERNKMSKVKEAFINLGNAVCNLNNEFLQYPVIPYIVLPENDKVVNEFILNYAKHSGQVRDGSIYSLPYKTFSDFTWYMFEYLSGNSYDAFAGQLQNIPNSLDRGSVVSYLNMPRQKKIDLQKKIQNFSDSTDFLEFINKRPLFSQLYFAQQISYPPASKCRKLVHVSIPEVPAGPTVQDYWNQLYDDKNPSMTRPDSDKNTNKKQFGESFVNYEDFSQPNEIQVAYESSPQHGVSKQDLYQRIIVAYKALSTLTIDIQDQGTTKRCMDLLKERGNTLKQLVLCSAYLHMFINIFQQEITDGYEKQYITLDEFFLAMWNPFYTDMFVNRIQFQFLTVFSTSNTGRAYKEFRKIYERFGPYLKQMMKSTYKAFWTGNNVGVPPKSSP